MPGIKDLIEQFHKRFKNVRLRLSWPREDHDLLDAYDPDLPSINETDADIDAVCAEFLALPWYPGKLFWPHNEELEADAYEAERLRLGEQAIASLVQFDDYLLVLKEHEAEASAMDEEERPAFRRNFRDAIPQRFPLLFTNGGRNGPREHFSLYDMGLLSEKLPKLLAITDNKQQIRAYCDLIGSCGDWGDSSGPCEIETVKQNLRRHAERKRHYLEKHASKLAQKHKCSVSSLKFIAVLHRELERHHDRRQGLREDGLCATAYPGTMAGFDQWNEMNQDIQSDIRHIRDILEWLQENCPLLWATYQERKRQRKEAKST